MSEEHPTPELLRQLLRYEPETGKLFWLERPLEMFASFRAYKIWNSRFAREEAFTSISSFDYRRGSIFNRLYQGHRIAWAVHYGEWPVGEVDHVDGDRKNNAISNLRLATSSENKFNRGMQKNNTSGFKGVFRHTKTGKWYAQIGHGKARTSSPLFETPEVAYGVYCQMATRLHGDFARVA